MWGLLLGQESPSCPWDGAGRRAERGSDQTHHRVLSGLRAQPSPCPPALTAVDQGARCGHHANLVLAPASWHQRPHEWPHLVFEWRCLPSAQGQHGDCASLAGKGFRVEGAPPHGTLHPGPQPRSHRLPPGAHGNSSLKRSERLLSPAQPGPRDAHCPSRVPRGRCLTSGTHIGEETREEQSSLKYRWERGAFHLLTREGLTRFI